jgi:uncharacterized protein (TIGR03435 family)
MRLLALCPLLVAGAFAQTTAPLSFEVASVKPATPLKPGESRGTRFKRDGIDFYTTLRYCISYAYGVKDYQVSAPSWLRDTTFEIIAKAPAGATREQFPEMIRTLLAERFKLQVHRETKDLDGFALVVTKDGPKLTPATAKPDSAGRVFTFQTRMSPGGNGTIDYKANSMAALARNLASLIGRPVLDETGLEGTYSLMLEYNQYDSAGGNAFRVVGGTPPPPDAEPGVSIFTSIQKYGLKLEPRRVPGDVIVVDRIEKTPTEN